MATKSKTPSQRAKNGQFLPEPKVENKVSPLLLREEEINVLIEFLSSVPLSGFNSVSHNILVRLLGRLRRYRGETVF